MITKPEIARAVARLSAAGYNAPRDADAFLDLCYDRFRGKPFDSTHLMVAVNGIIDGGDSYFPKVGRLLALMAEVRSEDQQGKQGPSSDWNQTLEGPCPTCGALLRLLEPEDQVNYAWDDEKRAYVNQNAIPKANRYGVLHDLAKHRSAGTVAVGYWR